MLVELRSPSQEARRIGFSHSLPRIGSRTSSPRGRRLKIWRSEPAMLNARPQFPLIHATAWGWKHSQASPTATRHSKSLMDASDIPTRLHSRFVTLEGASSWQVIADGCSHHRGESKFQVRMDAHCSCKFHPRTGRLHLKMALDDANLHTAEAPRAL